MRPLLPLLLLLASCPKPTAPPPSPSPQDEPPAAQAPADLEPALGALARRAAACYAEMLAQGPIAGRILLGVTVGTPGTVREIQVIEDDTGAPAFTACVAEAARGLSVNPMESEIYLEIPFAFAPAADEP